MEKAYQHYTLWIEAEAWATDSWIPIDTNTDVIATFADGSRWMASFVSYQNVHTLTEKNKISGECLAGAYFWTSDMLIVDVASRSRIEEVVQELLNLQQFDLIFTRIPPEDDEIYEQEFEGASSMPKPPIPAHQGDEIRPTSSHSTSYEAHDRIALFAGRLLDRSDSVIYAIVGVCFLFGGIFALGYSFWHFGITLLDIPTTIAQTKDASSPLTAPSVVANTIIQFISDLLLVLIIMEVLGTVIHYLQSHSTSLRPFLFIGIISATRGILSIGARLAAEGRGVSGSEFTNSMIELGVNAAVILALGITIKLLGRQSEDHQAPILPQ